MIYLWAALASPAMAVHKEPFLTLEQVTDFAASSLGLCRDFGWFVTTQSASSALKAIDGLSPGAGKTVTLAQEKTVTTVTDAMTQAGLPTYKESKSMALGYWDRSLVFLGEVHRRIDTAMEPANDTLTRWAREYHAATPDGHAIPEGIVDRVLLAFFIGFILLKLISCGWWLLTSPCRLCCRKKRGATAMTKLPGSKGQKKQCCWGLAPLPGKGFFTHRAATVGTLGTCLSGPNLLGTAGEKCNCALTRRWRGGGLPRSQFLGRSSMLKEFSACCLIAMHGISASFCKISKISATCTLQIGCTARKCSKNTKKWRAAKARGPTKKRVCFPEDASQLCVTIHFVYTTCV